MTSIPGWWRRVSLVLWPAAIALVAYSVWSAFVRAPVEQVMGPVQKIFYIHVPSASMATVAFTVTFAAGAAYLLTRHAIWDAVGAASCEVGMVFATIVMVTGPLWARSAWNTWWTWEPRLTTFFILWILYAGYHLIRASIKSTARRTVSAVLGIMLFVSVIVVYMSINWWRQGAFHPKTVTMTAEMRQIFGLSMGAWMVFYLAVFERRLRLEWIRETMLDDDGAAAPIPAAAPGGPAR
jgi:heme exporter protein C